jgi:hypothetical protein
MDSEVRKYDKADAWGKDAVAAVTLCRQWVGGESWRTHRAHRTETSGEIIGMCKFSCYQSRSDKVVIFII